VYARQFEHCNSGELRPRVEFRNDLVPASNAGPIATTTKCSIARARRHNQSCSRGFLSPHCRIERSMPAQLSTSLDLQRSDRVPSGPNCPNCPNRLSDLRHCLSDNSESDSITTSFPRAVGRRVGLYPIQAGWLPSHRSSRMIVKGSTIEA
jgi:hypothetical protein